MSQYPYYVRTLTNNINVTLLNYLYAKGTAVTVTIDTSTYNIFIQMQNEVDFNDVLTNVKKYYTEYTVYIPPPPTLPVFSSEPLSESTSNTSNVPSEPTTDNSSNVPTEPSEPTTDNSSNVPSEPTPEPTTDNSNTSDV
jgi:hypothetical protein